MAVLRAARRNWLVWFVVLPVALWALVRELGFDSGFPVVALMAFTPYVAVAALLVAGIAIALENWVAAAVGALATLALAAAVLPRAIGDGTVEAAGRETVGVLSINSKVGRVDAAAAVALIERLRPDLLSLQEMTPELASELERRGIDELLPHQLISTAKGASSIYSTLPLQRIGEPGDFGLRMPRARVELPGGGTVRVVAVHPVVPGRHGVREWEEELADLPSAGRGAPWILVGDYNATIDHAELRGVIDRGYSDAGSVAGQGLEPTWPVNGLSDLPPVTIDHVLLDRRLDLVDYSVWDLPGTDHRPIYALLALP
jgi:endonuclease/exonuclease/phosphatase (EEP) superfamily protein YafD